MESCLTTDLPTVQGYVIYNTQWNCDRISRGQRVDIFGLTYRNKAKSPHPKQIVKTPLHTFQKHNLFEVDSHARSCKPLRRLATNAAINAPPVPKALLRPHFRLPNRKTTWKAAGLGRAASRLPTASANSRHRAERAATTAELGDAVIAPTPNSKPRYPWSFVAAISKRIASLHRASGGKSCGKLPTENLKENAPYKVKTGY